MALKQSPHTRTTSSTLLERRYGSYSSKSTGLLYSARPYKAFIAAQRIPVGPLESIKLSVNQAKNFRPHSHQLRDDLLSIRSHSPHGNSEISTNFPPLRYSASTDLTHRLSLLAFVVPRLWESPLREAGKTVPLPQEWCARIRTPIPPSRQRASLGPPFGSACLSPSLAQSTLSRPNQPNHSSQAMRYNNLRPIP